MSQRGDVLVVTETELRVMLTLTGILHFAAALSGAAMAMVMMGSVRVAIGLVVVCLGAYAGWWSWRKREDLIGLIKKETVRRAT